MPPALRTAFGTWCGLSKRDYANCRIACWALLEKLANMENSKSLIGKGFIATIVVAVLVLLVLLAMGWRPTSVGIDAGPVSIELAPMTPSPNNNGSQEIVKASPTPPLTEKFQMLSLESYSELSAPETNLGLAPGQYSASDIPFTVGWKTSTQCSHIPERPQSIFIETNIPNSRYAYFLLQAGWGWSRYRDKKIGEIVFHFADSSSTTTSLSLGYNIRDWSRNNDSNVVTLVFSPDVMSAWDGTAPDGRKGGIDMLTIRIPADKASQTLSGIEILDLSETIVGDIDPCIHLIAITVRYAE